MTETIHGKLIAKRNGIYTVYVFEKDNQEYIMCTKLPNWGDYNILIGDSGFLTIEYVIAGDKYFDRETESERIYKYSNVYFKDFIKDMEKEDIIL